MAKDVNILFDELEAVNSPCKDDDSLLHPGNLTSTSDDASRLGAAGEVRMCDFLKKPQFLFYFFYILALCKLTFICFLFGNLATKSINVTHS